MKSSWELPLLFFILSWDTSQAQQCYQCSLRQSEGTTTTFRDFNDATFSNKLRLESDAACQDADFFPLTKADYLLKPCVASSSCIKILINDTEISGNKVTTLTGYYRGCAEHFPDFGIGSGCSEITFEALRDKFPKEDVFDGFKATSKVDICSSPLVNRENRGMDDRKKTSKNKVKTKVKFEEATETTLTSSSPKFIANLLLLFFVAFSL